MKGKGDKGYHDKFNGWCDIVMARVVMAYVVMAYVLMAYIDK